MARVAELSAEITAETGDFERGLSNVEKAIAGTRTTIGGLDKDISLMGRNMGSANDAMRAMGISLPITPMAALGTGIKVVGDYMKAAIGETVAYAAQVRDLGRSIGASAEQTSMLIQAADDVNVSVASLTSGLQAAIRKGVKPSIEGLGELADQYNAIQDPIERTKFLMDNFGRSGADLAPLMEKGAAGIKKLGAAAEAAGLVLSGEAVQAARDYEIAIDGLEDSAQALKLALGKELIPALTAVISTMNNTLSVQQEFDAAMKANALSAEELAVINMSDFFGGKLWHDEAIAALHAATARAEVAEAAKAVRRAIELESNAVEDGQGFWKALTSEVKKSADGFVVLAGKASVSAEAMTKTGRAAGGLRDSFKFAYDAGMLLEMGLAGDLLDATEEYNKVMVESTLAIEEYHAAMAEGGEAAEAVAGTLDDLIAAQGDAEDAIRKATAEIVLQQVAMALGADGALEFAHATGIMSDADYELGKALQRATDAADLNRDGIINTVAEQKILLEETLRVTDQTAALATGTELATTNMNSMAESTSPLVGGLDLVATAADHVVTAVDFIQPEVAIDTTPAISSLDNATTSAYNFHRELDGIPRNITVDIITNNHTNYSGYQLQGTGDNNAAGADFVVPAGFPHDSYPMNVQSGERVQVTPAGAPRTGSGSGNTINLIVNNYVAPVAGATLLQTARAVAGAMG